MIQEFVARFMNGKKDLRMVFAERHPGDYEDIVTEVVNVINSPADHVSPDPYKIIAVSNGGNIGTRLFVIGADDHHSSNYWSVKVDYGSCSECDTLEGICGCSMEPPTEEQLDDYMTLALHIVQNIKLID